MTLERASPGTSTPLQKLSVPKRTWRSILFEFAEQKAARHAFALDEEFVVEVIEPLAHGGSEGGHGAVAGEEDEGAALRFLDEVLDPLGEGGVVAGVARVGHFARDEEAHLLFVVERAADLQAGDVLGADAFAEVAELGVAGGEGGAGHDADVIFAKEEGTEPRGDVDGGGVEAVKFWKSCRSARSSRRGLRLPA